MKISHAGQTAALNVPDWRQRRSQASPEEGRLMDEWARDGVLSDSEGQPLDVTLELRIRDRLLFPEMETRTFFQQLRDHRASGGTRFLVPGLWPWGAYSQLGGPPKAGKTALVAELCASLLVPEHRFLGHFDPATLTEEEREMGVVLVNTEMDPGPVLDALAEAGVPEDAHLLPIHLREEGGARQFDLTDEGLYREWVHRLIWCEECDGSDEYPPVVVIVDNLTAVLQDVSRPLEAYGELHGKFAQLMREIGCPNGLAVVHNTLAGGHAMGGVTGSNRPDGLWNYWSDNPDDPAARRWFSVVPRLGGQAVPRSQVVQEEGRLRLMVDEGAAPVVTEAVLDYAAQVRERLDQAGDAGLLRKQVTGEGREGGLRRAALDALIQSGEVVTRPEPGRGNPRRCWLAVHQPLVTSDQSPRSPSGS